MPKMAEKLALLKKLRRRNGNKKSMTFTTTAKTLNVQGYTTLDGKPPKGANVAMIIKRAKG